MGITIYYNLEFDGTKNEIVNLLKGLTSDAYDLGFKFISSIWQVDYSTDLETIDEETVVSDSAREVYQWAKVQCQPSNCTINHNGLILNTQYDDFCEPTNIGLVRVGNGKKWRCESLFTKTQYAKDFVNAHSKVCAFLRCVDDAGLLGEVYDETGYWEDGDITKLIDTSEKSLKTIRGLNDLLNKAIMVSGETDIEIRGHGTRAKTILKEMPNLNW